MNFVKKKILTVTIESSFTADSNCSSSQRTDAKGAGFASPVVSSNIWSSLERHNTREKHKKRKEKINFAKLFSKVDSLHCNYINL